MPRKQAKFPFVNLLAASVWAPDSPRAPSDLEHLPPERQAIWYEWAVAQELYRRSELRGDREPERIPYWQGGGHEIDFVVAEDEFIEVKRGQATALEFTWFPRVFPKGNLTVVCSTPFETDRVRGLTLESFLQAQPYDLVARNRIRGLTVQMCRWSPDDGRYLPAGGAVMPCARSS